MEVTLLDTFDPRGAIPLSILTGQIVVPHENKARMTEELNDSAVGKQSTGGRVAGVTPILWFRQRETSWRKGGKNINIFRVETQLLNLFKLDKNVSNLELDHNSQKKMLITFVIWRLSWAILHDSFYT